MLSIEFSVENHIKLKLLLETSRFRVLTENQHFEIIHVSSSLSVSFWRPLSEQKLRNVSYVSGDPHRPSHLAGQVFILELGQTVKKQMNERT